MSLAFVGAGMSGHQQVYEQSEEGDLQRFLVGKRLLDLVGNAGTPAVLSTSERAQLASVMMTAEPSLSLKARDTQFWKHEASVENLALLKGSTYLASNAERVRTIYASLDRLLHTGGNNETFTADQIEALKSDTTELLLHRLEEILEKADRADRLDTESRIRILSGEEAQELAVIRGNAWVDKFNENELLELLKMSAVVDQADYDRRSLMRGTILRTLYELREFVVAIVATDLLPGGGTRYTHLGTGFLYRERIITCAHLFTAAGLDSNGHIAFDRVLAVLADKDGRFTPGAATSVRVCELDAGSHLWFELDCACLKPVLVPDDEASNKLRQLFVKYEPHGTDLDLIDYSSKSEDLEVGITHALSTYYFPFHGIELSWMQPGPILYPRVVKMPREGQTSKGNNAYARALRNEVFGRISNPDRQTTALLDVVRDVVRALREHSDLTPSYTDARNYPQCALEYSADPKFRLPDFSQDQKWKANPRIACFGCDLVGEPGTSGSPVFLLRNGFQRVVGVHTGMYGANTAYPVPPSLSQMTRAVPFHVVKPYIDKFIEEEK